MDDSKVIHIDFDMAPSSLQHTLSFDDSSIDSWLSCYIDSDNFTVGASGELNVLNNQVLRSLEGAFYFDGENSVSGKKISITQGHFQLMYID